MQDKSTHWLINKRKPNNSRWHPPPTHELINSKTHQLTKSSAHKLISTRTHQHKNSSVQKLINSLTQKLKLLSFILQCCSNFRSVLAKIQAEKLVKNRFLYPFAPLALSIFTPRSCILHHFAFLVWVKADDFSSPFFCF